MDKTNELRNKQKENREKYQSLNQDIKKVEKMQEDYANLALNVKKQIDNVYLCWTGSEAAKYIDNANEGLIISRDRFNLLIEEQINILNNNKKKLEKEYDSFIAKPVEIDKDRGKKDENKLRGIS